MIKQLSEHVYYLPGGVNCALIVHGQEAILIDTGQDKDSGRRLKKACEQLDVKPRAIINSHAHADHYGGNAYLISQFDIPVYAPDFEAGIMQYPYLEPVYLFSGARPPQAMLSKWLLAKPSRVDHLLEPGTLELLGLEFALIDTSGHAHRQLSFIVDDVLLATDAVFGAAVLAKYPLAFGQDIAQQIASTRQLQDLNARLVLPGHGDPSENIAAMIEANLESYQRAAKLVFSACENTTTEDVCLQVCQQLDIQLTDIARFYLHRCTVMAYLSYLQAQQRIDFRFEQNQLLWFQRT